MAKLPESLPPQIAAALERGRPIEAIKLLLRARARGARVPRSPPASPQKQPPAGTRSGLSPGEVPRTESAVWVWVVVALLVYLAYRLVGP